jgi:hypothetical protein
MFDCRTWIFTKLSALVPVTSVVGSRIFQSLDLEDTPTDKPFIVCRLDPSVPDIPGAMFQDLVLWIHDEPGSYLRIDTLIQTIRENLDGVQVNDPEGIAVVWQGDSPDMADDLRGTILRTSSYRLAGRR